MKGKTKPYVVIAPFELETSEGDRWVYPGQLIEVGIREGIRLFEEFKVDYVDPQAVEALGSWMH